MDSPDYKDCGVPRRLIFAGKQMGDEKQAKDYNVEGGSVLHLVSIVSKLQDMLSSGFFVCPAGISACGCMSLPPFARQWWRSGDAGIGAPWRLTTVDALPDHQQT